MTNLIKGKYKSQKLDWIESAEECFQKIKDTSCICINFIQPGFSKKFTIQCDAGDIGICWIFEEYESDQEVVIAFANCILTVAERKYYVTEKKLIAILFRV